MQFGFNHLRLDLDLFFTIIGIKHKKQKKITLSQSVNYLYKNSQEQAYLRTKITWI